MAANNNHVLNNLFKLIDETKNEELTNILLENPEYVHFKIEDVSDYEEVCNGTTLLLYALDKENFDMASFLITMGSDLKALNNFNISPLRMLMMAAKDMDSAKLDKFKDIFYQIKKLMTKEEFLKALNENGNKDDERNCLALLLIYQNVDSIKVLLPMLVDNGAVYHCAWSNNPSPLWESAILFGRNEPATYEKMIEKILLIEESFSGEFTPEKLNEKAGYLDGKNFLQHAISTSNLFLLNMAMDKGVRIEPDSISYLLSNHYNLNDDSIKIANILLDNGASPTVKGCNSGRTFIEDLIAKAENTSNFDIKQKLNRLVSLLKARGYMPEPDSDASRGLTFAKLR